MENINASVITALILLSLIVLVLSVRLRNASKRIDLLDLANRKLNSKAEIAKDKQLTAEQDVATQNAKLEKLGLLKFSAWLFDDDEFVSTMKAKVEELRPVALDRYNAGKAAEMARINAEREESNRRSRELLAQREQERKDAEKKRYSSSSTMADASMAAVIATTTAVSVDVASCDGGSACM